MRYLSSKLMATAISFMPCMAFASTASSQSWERTLYKLSSSLTGPVAYSIALIAIAACGLAMGFCDLQGGAKRFVQAACGLSIAFFATTIVTSFIGFQGALI